MLKLMVTPSSINSNMLSGCFTIVRGTNTTIQSRAFESNNINGRIRPKSSWASRFQRNWTSWYDRKVPMPVKDMGLMLHEADKNQPVMETPQVIAYGDENEGNMP